MVYPTTSYNNNSISSISRSTGNTFGTCIAHLSHYKSYKGVRGRTQQSNSKAHGWIVCISFLLLLGVVVSYHWQLGELTLTVDVDLLKRIDTDSNDVNGDDNDAYKIPVQGEGIQTSRTTNVTRTQSASTVVKSDAPNTFGIQPTYQNPTILREGCLITVLLMDPDISLSAIWTLESVAEFVQPTERVCVFLQTSVCNVDTQKRAKAQGNSNADMAYQIKADRIRQEAPPHLARMIRQGQVRMTILDYKKYHLSSCKNFYNPSFAWENIQYWGDAEFLPGIDADLVLTVQDDAVLCQTLNVFQWKDNVAWLGAPWLPLQGSKAWHYCTAMPTNWEKFHNDLGNNAATDFPTPEEMCSNVAYGPQGNGGLSLRLRSWLRDVIRYCPTSIFENSGLSKEEFEQAKCQATEIAAEDSYFVTILRGMGAPLPSALDAALFSWESQTIPQILASYDPPALNCPEDGQAKCSSNGTQNARWDQRTVTEWIASRWTVSNADVPQLADTMIADSLKDPKSSFVRVPIGIHKPWNEFFKTSWMCHPGVHQQCKYLRKTLQHNKYGQKALNKQNRTLEHCIGEAVQ